MERAGVVAAIVVLIGAAVAIRRDRRITHSEFVVKVTLIAGYLAIAGAITWLAVDEERGQRIVAAVLLTGWLLIALPLLARYLSRRLRRRG